MTTTQSIKAGTRIELPGRPAIPEIGFPGVAPQQATIARWLIGRNGRHKNHVYGNPGWHIVRFNDGGRLCVHETNFRVIDNRASHAPVA